MGGVFVGCMIWGWASDKFGRRLTMLVAAVIQGIFKHQSFFFESHGG